MPQELVKRFKEPFGLLIPGPPEVAVRGLKEVLSEEGASKIIAVGDVVSKSLKDSGIEADVYVMDGKVMRRRMDPLEFEGIEVIRIANPPGQLTAEAFSALRESLRRIGPIRIEVEGEEDLLVLPAVILAPEGSLVVYGQPGKGLVAVRVSEEKRREALELYRAMPELESP